METVRGMWARVEPYKVPVLVALVGLVLVVLIYRYLGAGGLSEGYEPSYGQDAEGFYVDDQNANGPDEGFDGSDDNGDNSEGFSETPRKLVGFMADWCGNCRNLSHGEDSVWSRLEKKYRGHPTVKVEKIDCDKYPELATKHQIRAYPTIKLFVGDKSYEYDGDRSFDDLDSFIHKN